MTVIITKNSSTASAVPTTADLVKGELAVNVTDKRIFTENASTQIVELGTNPSTVTTATATVSGTLTANGTFASSNAVITGGTINSTPIGATTPSTVQGTTVTATTGFVGGLTGNVVGNVTGNVTGNLTGNVTGNVTASTGTTTLNNLVVNGTADFTNTKLLNVADPTISTDAATKNYVDSFLDQSYLGAKAADPTLDNEGNALAAGDTYFNTADDEMRVYTGSSWVVVSPTATSVTLSQVTDFPTQSGQSGKYLTTNGTVPSWATLTTDPTLGTLTKTFVANESASISLTSSVLAPVVSVTKEVPQSGVTNNSWDVSSTAENYTRLDSAYATTLNFVAGISDASFVQSFSVAAKDSVPRDVVFNSDGTKMFILGDAGNKVHQYALSTGFDVSTASFVQSLDISNEGTSPEGLAFNADGTKMFVSDVSVDAVNQYALSTGFDISTASFSQSFSVSGQDNVPTNIAFNTDGTKMFILGDAGNDVNEYSLTTGFDISTASFVDSFSVAAQETSPNGLAFNADGTKMFVVGFIADTVFQYNLTTGFDVSTASYSSISFNVASQDGNPTGIAFNTDGTTMFIVGYQNDSVYEYLLGYSSLALGTGSFASADVGKTIEANSGVFVLTATDGSYVETTAPTSYDQVASGDWSMYGVVYNAADGDLELSKLLLGYYLADASYDSVSFSVAAQIGVANGLAFNSDGTKMFIVDTSPADVNEYTLSTGFDITTATFVDSFSVSAQDTSPRGIAFNTDGTKMFIVGQYGKDVNEYTLSTGFDVSTSSFVDSFSVSAQDTVPIGLAFNTNGTKMFVVGYLGDDVNEYTLSTPFDVSTASFVDSFSISAQETGPTGIAFNADGTRMFVTGFVGDDVNEYTLSTGFDVSTATYNSITFSVSAQETSPSAIAFNTDGTKMFIIGNTSDTVFQYSTSADLPPTGYHPVHTTASIDTTYWTDINSMTADQNAGDGEVYYAISTDDRTTWTVIDNTDGERDIVRNNAGTWQYNSNATYASETWVDGTTNAELATLAEAMEGASFTIGFDVSTSSFVDSFSIAAQDGAPRGLAFNSDGTKMFVVGSLGDEVNEYNLSTGFDVSTASYSQVFSVNAQDTNPNGLAFNADGTKMFIAGGTGQDINEYALTTGFDVSTASFTQNFSVSAQDTSPQGLAFNIDGTKMFVVGVAGQDVNEYTLSTGFNISTASFVDSFSIAAQENLPRGLAFNTDGTKMYVVGQTGQDVNEYTLTTGFDVSTASYSQSFSVSSQDLYPEGIAFNTDGTKMFVSGGQGADINEYTLGTTVYTNQMDKTQLDAVTDPNHIALGDDLDLAIVFNMTSGSTVPSSDGVAINYDANVLNKGAVLGTDYDFDAPTQSSVRITALAGNNFKVRVV